MDTGEHLVAALFEVGGAGQIDQEPQRFSRDPMLAVVDVEVADRDGQLAAAIGVLVEELAQMGGADAFMVPAQGVPRGVAVMSGRVCRKSLASLLFIASLCIVADAGRHASTLWALT